MSSEFTDSNEGERGPDWFNSGFWKGCYAELG